MGDLIDEPMTWVGSDQEIIAAGQVSREVQEPDWDGMTEEDWRWHVGNHARRIWSDLLPEHRAALACDASWAACNHRDSLLAGR